MIAGATIGRPMRSRARRSASTIRRRCYPKRSWPARKASAYLAVVRRRQFRFAVQEHHAASAAQWGQRARDIESMGYSALYLPDHFTEQPGVVAALMAAADATTKLRVGSLVFDNDYRHPVVLAKEAATLDLLSH